MTGAAPPLLFHGARVLTLGAGPDPRRGGAARELGVIERGDVLAREGVVEAVGEGLDARGARIIEASGRVLMPAFIDAHTHACWAGTRLDEWEAKLRGASYLDQLRAGGGIMSTVRAVRAASENELTEGLVARLARFESEGTAAVEIKSGYGLDTETELKMLRAIRSAGRSWGGHVTPTACIGHAIDPGQDRFIERVINETLPAVHDAFPGVAIDAYCEAGAWSRDDAIRLFERAEALGHSIRVHADQFNDLGMLDAAVELGALSVDHLEATPPDALDRLAASETFGVMLPCSGFHLDDRYADGRRFLDAGGALVIATNCNPGSAPCLSMPMAIALACRKCGLTPAEAIACCTANAAALLGLTGRGRIERGARADLLMLGMTDERELAHTFGGNPCDLVLVGGAVVFDRVGEAAGLARD